MKTVAALLAHPGFQARLAAIERKETTRRFCRHGLDHALDVARISWILALENGRAFDKETVYLAALLHDLGRSEDDASHDAASVRLARTLLADCGASAETIADVCAAIGAHREKAAAIDPASASLGQLLAFADKKSRLCWRCAARDDCHWPEAAKNTTIIC